jgi:hypothetical protein
MCTFIVSQFWEQWSKKNSNLERLSSLEINLARLDKDSSMNEAYINGNSIERVTLQKRFSFYLGQGHRCPL